MGVEIVPSIEALLEKVDVVLLETNDGRPHLEQAAPVLKAGKPVFIDKPVAGTLADVVAIYELSKRYGTPVFSSSALRYAAGVQEVVKGKVGKILACDAYSPAVMEPNHPDLFWYGIHGVEFLYTVMGPGCVDAEPDEHAGRRRGGGKMVRRPAWNLPRAAVREARIRRDRLRE